MGSGQSCFHFWGGSLKVDERDVFGGGGSGGGGLHLNLLGKFRDIFSLRYEGSSFQFLGGDLFFVGRGSGQEVVNLFCFPFF